MFWPATTGSGLSVFVTWMSADVCTVELNVAKLLPLLASDVAALTVAVLLSVEALASLAAMLSVYTNMSEPPATSVVLLQVIGPLGPDEQIFQLVAPPNEAKVAPDGIVSVSVTFWESLGPLLVTMTVYVAWPPAVTMAGPVLLTATSAEVATVVTVEEELLAPLASLVALKTLAVLVIVEPLASVVSALTTRVNVALAPAASVAVLPMTVPVPPAGGFVKVNAGPAVCISETKVVPAGTVSVSTTF